MANVKITDLGAYTNPVSTDVLPIVDVSADSTKKVSIADLLENAGSGTAAAPGIAFDGDSDTGIYRPGANQVAISTNGTGRLFVDASGNVGVGTSSPTELIDIDANGNSYLRWERNGAGGSYSALTSGGVLRIGPYYSATDRELALFTDNANNSWVTTGTAQSLTLGTNKTARITIDFAGRVGIGTTGPDSTLTIKAATNVTPLRVSGPSSEFARIDSSGRLLVGTSSDSGGALLQVNGNRIRVATAKTPASASDTGTAGEVCWDANYVYVCTATNTWKRAALSTW